MARAKEASQRAEVAPSARPARARAAFGLAAVPAVAALLALVGCKKENAFVPPPLAEVGVR
jgi:hypothetical protein